MKRARLGCGLAVLVAALLLRLDYVGTLELPQPVRADARVYVTTAANLVARGVYSSFAGDPPRPSTYVPPGYPLLLAAILASSADPGEFYRSGGFYRTTLMVQAALGALTAWLLFALVLDLTRRLVPAALAGIVFVLLPHYVTFAGYLLTETWFTFLLALDVYLFLRAARAPGPGPLFVFGLVGALAALVRSVYLPVPLLGLALLAWTRAPGAGRAALGAGVLGIAAAWLPWQLWSTAQPPHPQDRDQVAISLAFGGYVDLTHAEGGVPGLRGFPSRDDPHWPAISASKRAALASVWERARAAPAAYVRWYLVGKPALYWSWDILQGQGGPFVYGPVDSIYQRIPALGAQLVAFRAAHPLAVAAAALASLAWLGLAARKRGQASDLEVCLAFVALVLAFHTAVYCILTPLPRYSVPLHGLVYLVLVVTLHQVLQLVRRRPGREAAPRAAPAHAAPPARPAA